MRTPGQIAADEQLTAAIIAINAAYCTEPEQNVGVITDYVVIFAEQGFNAEGDGLTLYGTFSRDDGVPRYRVLGLLDIARRRFLDGSE